MTAHDVRALLRKILGARHQGLLAQDIGIARSHLNWILCGKREPAGKVLEFLGLVRVVTYQPRSVHVERPADSDAAAREQ